MKPLVIALIMIQAFQAQAKYADSKPRPFNGAKTIFESLLRFQNPSVTIKAPMEIVVEDVVCSVGSGKPHTPHCVAALKKQDKITNEPIENSERFFNSLMSLNAISLDEMMEGGNTYKAKRISCAYNLDSQPYYKCTSEVSVRF